MRREAARRADGVSSAPITPEDPKANVWFLALTIGLIFVAHATAYFTYEYSHAVTAWSLGWMRSPVAIDYGRPTLANVLFQQDIGDGVNYAPIFAHRHGLEAALIAFDRPGVGNGVLYAACALLLRSAAVRARRVVSMFLFWLAVMGAGNVWSYAPVRTVTTHADMALVARGLGISTWLLPLVTAPSLAILWSLFARLLPLARGTIFPRNPVAETSSVLLTSYLYSGFFGAAAFYGSYGDVSALFSILSMIVLYTIVTVLCLFGSRPLGFGETRRFSGRFEQSNGDAVLDQQTLIEGLPEQSRG